MVFNRTLKILKIVLKQLSILVMFLHTSLYQLYFYKNLLLFVVAAYIVKAPTIVHVITAAIRTNIYPSKLG